ncbi:MAG: hypothetical protein JRH06_01190 [Deltaproteobacteria bacterium]|nr:hypothetical protein [Deltaproteobacteria bacterium]MBW2136154.1 hypothetical protein [Deltaproteobacteria bacterium]
MIEIFIVVVMIFILATICINQFVRYKSRSYNSAAQMDLRTAASVQEAYFVDQKTYTSDITNLLNSSYGLYTTDGVNLTVTDANSSGYTMQAVHFSGSHTYSIIGPGGKMSD